MVANNFINLSLKNKPMYSCDEDTKIYFHDLVRALKQSGIKKGDILFVHVNLGAFGKLGLIKSRKELTNLFIEAFIESVGHEGTVITPTYTYSFCDNEIYNPQNSPSKVGYFSEEFRLRKDSYRTINPLFSVSAIGGNAKKLTSGLSKTSFGRGSIFDRLQNEVNSKYVVAGVDHFICSHVHYIECLMNVPYRYIKKFKGEIKVNGKLYQDEYEYNVRYLNKNVNTTFNKLEKHLLENRFMNRAKLGWNYISTVEINVIYKESINMLKKDPFFFLKNKPDLKYNERNNKKIS